MNALYSLLAVLALVLAGIACGQSEAARMVFFTYVPYAAFAVLLVGFCCRVVRWASAPVPFHIPVTCGQQKSLPWIRPAKFDNPSTGLGVVSRMAAEVLLFRSLFRNNRARLSGGRLILGESAASGSVLWPFIGRLLLILLRHLRLFLEPVPAFVNALDRLDSFFQIGAPQLYLSDVILVAALAYLLFRRFRDPALRYLSLFSDYFALFLAAGHRRHRHSHALLRACRHPQREAVCAEPGRILGPALHKRSAACFFLPSAAGLHAGGLSSRSAN